MTLKEKRKNKRYFTDIQYLKSARKKIRTSTFLRIQAPQACASTNSAIRAILNKKS